MAVCVQFVCHECPSAVIDSLVAECARLLRPGGTLAIADNNPRSKVIQNLPPVLFTLMKRWARAAKAVWGVGYVGGGAGAGACRGPAVVEAKGQRCWEAGPVCSF